MTGIFLGAELMMNHWRVHDMIAGHLADLARGTLRVVVDRTYLSERGGGGARVHGEPQGVRRVLLIP